VYPSAGARAARSVPVVPPAPRHSPPRTSAQGDGRRYQRRCARDVGRPAGREWNDDRDSSGRIVFGSAPLVTISPEMPAAAIRRLANFHPNPSFSATICWFRRQASRLEQSAAAARARKAPARNFALHRCARRRAFAKIHGSLRRSRRGQPLQARLSSVPVFESTARRLNRLMKHVGDGMNQPRNLPRSGLGSLVLIAAILGGGAAAFATRPGGFHPSA
jgi:hypothetical protein